MAFQTVVLSRARLKPGAGSRVSSAFRAALNVSTRAWGQWRCPLPHRSSDTT